MLTLQYDIWDLFNYGNIIETSVMKLNFQKSNGFLFPHDINFARLSFKIDDSWI